MVIIVSRNICFYIGNVIEYSDHTEFHHSLTNSLTIVLSFVGFLCNLLRFPLWRVRVGGKKEIRTIIGQLWDKGYLSQQIMEVLSLYD